MSNQYRTTFYIGVTAYLDARIWQHINNEGSAFVKKYKLYDLVYFEYFERIGDAIDREKQLKRWHKDWKINLIRSVNPEMKDLKTNWICLIPVNDHLIFGAFLLSVWGAEINSA